MRPLAPNSARSAATATSIAASIAAKVSAIAIRKLRPKCGGSSAGSRRPRTANTPPSASAVDAAATHGTSATVSVPRSVAPITAINWTKVATADSSAAATPALRHCGAARTQPPIAPIVAELDAKPDTSPSTGTPSRAPSTRIAISPAAVIARIMITTSPIACGLIAENGPIARLGSSGSRTSAAPPSASTSTAIDRRPSGGRVMPAASLNRRWKFANCDKPWPPARMDTMSVRGSVDQ